MATGITLSSTSNLSSGQKILVASAREAFEPAAPDPDLIANKSIGVGQKQYDQLIYARLAQANALTEGVDLAQSEQLVANTISITPTEHGIIATLSKRLIRRQGDKDVVGTTGRMIGASLKRRMANDVIALYDTFTKSIVGASVGLDITYFRGAMAYLLTDNNSAYGPAPLPLKASLHIEQISDIMLDLTNTTGTTAGNAPFANGLSQELVQRWWKGSDRLYSIQIWNSGLISRDTSGDSKGAIFAEESMYIVTANEADATEEKDNSLRATEYGIFQEWGEALAVDPHGLEVYSDTAATV